MTSPYFYKMNVAQADYSPIERAGRAWGEAFKDAGEAFGEIGSAYFEKKGIEKSALDFIMSPDGEDYLRTDAGWDDTAIQEMKQDPKKARNHVTRAMQESGGAEKFKEALIRRQQNRRNAEMHEQQLEINKKQKKQLGYALKDLEQKEVSQETTQRLYGYIFQKQDDGTIKADVNNMLVKMKPEEAQEGYAIIQSLGMNNMNFGSFMQSLKQSNPDIVTYPQQMKGALMNTLAMYPQMKGEDQKRMQDMLPEHIIEPSKITDSAKDFWGADKQNESRREALMQMDTLRINIKTAIGTDDSGKKFVKNNPAAATAMRNFARVANGAGVMTDKDVSSVGGPKNIGAVVDRLLNTYFTDQTREATEQDVREGLADRVGEEISINTGAIVTVEDLELMREATAEIEKYTRGKLQDAGVATQEHLAKTYSTISGERLLELNPYAEHFHDAYSMQIQNEQWPIMGQMYAREGEEALKNALLSSNPRMQDSQFEQIKIKLQQEEMASDQGFNSGQATGQPNVAPIENKKDPETGLDADENKTSSNNTEYKREDGLNFAEKLVETGEFVGKTAIAGALTNGAWNKVYNVSDKVSGKILDKKLTPAAERLLPEKIKNALKANPSAMLQKHGGLGDVAKKYGINNAQRLTPETLEKKVVAEIKEDMKAKLAQLGDKGLMAKLKKMLKPDKLGKKMIPYVGAAFVMQDIVDLSTLFDGDPESVAKQQKVIEQKMMSAGVNPLELLFISQAMEELQIEEMSKGVGVQGVANALRGSGASLLDENNVGKNLEARRSALGKATEIKPMPKKNRNRSSKYFK